jgi:hypothetical protein
LERITALMKTVLVLAIVLHAAVIKDPDIWQECQIESATLCGAGGCKPVAPTLKLFLGDYVGESGRRAGYYYRCRRGNLCDIVDDPWIGESGGYRAFIMRDRGVMARVGPDNSVTDVATIEDIVLISRGRCWKTQRPRVSRVVERAN